MKPLLSSKVFLETSRELLKNNFHALTHKDFRYYWLGQCVSLIGTWAQSTGQSWLVLQLTGSSLKLGVVSTVQFIPITVFSLFAGLLIDKFPKKKILLVTQSVSMCLAFILSALVFTNTVRYWHILLLAFLLGVSNCVDMPTRQSFTIEIAGKEDLMNAIALNSVTFNLARIIGPTIGALIMAYTGPAWCFFINGASFIAVIYGLLHIESRSYVRKKKNNSNVIVEIGEGLKYIIHTPILIETVLMVTVLGVFAFNYNVLIPAFTKNVLLQSEKTYGFLLSSLGLGSFIGAMIVSARSKRGPKKSVMFTASMMLSVMLALIAFSRDKMVTAVFLVITGVCNIFFSTTANSTLQLQAKDEYRARVMSVYTLVFAGSTPLGSLFAGYISDRYGTDKTFLINGILTFVLIGFMVVIYRKNTNKKDVIEELEVISGTMED